MRGEQPSLKEFRNLDELVTALSRLSDEIFKLKSEVASHLGIDVRSPDVRLVALAGIQQDLLPCGWWLNTMMALEREVRAKFDGTWEKEFLVKIGAGPGAHANESERLDKVTRDMVDYLRLSVPVKIAFRIENMFSRLLREVDKTSPFEFGQVLSTLLTKLQLVNQSDVEAPLRALAAVRNSLHNNGIHRKQSQKWIVDGVHFDFTEGQKVTCAWWTHLMLLFNASVRSIRTILFTSPLVDLKGEIPDDFAAYPKGSENGSPKS